MFDTEEFDTLEKARLQTTVILFARRLRNEPKRKHLKRFDPEGPKHVADSYSP